MLCHGLAQVPHPRDSKYSPSSRVTTDAMLSTSRLYGFGLFASFLLCFLSSHLCNLVAPNLNTPHTSYFQRAGFLLRLLAVGEKGKGEGEQGAEYHRPIAVARVKGETCPCIHRKHGVAVAGQVG